MVQWAFACRVNLTVACRGRVCFAAVKGELVEACVEFKRTESPEDSIAAHRRVLEAQQERSEPAAVREELVEAYEESKRAEGPEDSAVAHRRVFAATEARACWQPRSNTCGRSPIGRLLVDTEIKLDGLEAIGL